MKENNGFGNIFSSFLDSMNQSKETTDSEQDNKEQPATDEDSIKLALLQKYEEICGFPPIDDDYAPRIRNILKEVCDGEYTKDQIIDFEDTSVSSNGRSGVVFTTEALCVKDKGNSTSKFIAKFEDIDYTYLNEERFLGVDISTLELHMKYGATYKLSITMSIFSLKRMQRLIDYAISLYEDNDKLEW